MISLIPSESHISDDPYIVPSPLDVNLYGAHMLPLVGDITSSMVLSTPPHNVHKPPPNMKYDHDDFTTWVVTLTIAHDSLNVKFPSQ